MPKIQRLQIAYAVHSVNHVIALNKRKHSIVLKYVLKKLDRTVYYTFQIFALTANILTVYRLQTYNM